MFFLPSRICHCDASFSDVFWYCDTSVDTAQKDTGSMSYIFKGFFCGSPKKALKFKLHQKLTITLPADLSKISCLLELLDSLRFFSGSKAGWVELFGRNVRAMLGIRMDENWLIFFCLNPDRRSKNSNFDKDRDNTFNLNVLFWLFSQVPGSCRCAFFLLWFRFENARDV